MVPTIGQQIKKVVFIFIVYQLASAVLKTGKEDLAEEEGEEEKINRTKISRELLIQGMARNCLLTGISCFEDRERGSQ